LTQWWHTFRYFLASRAYRGATDVDPLAVIVGFAWATAGTAAKIASDARIAALRSRFDT
jgi:hypothetical protein